MKQLTIFADFNNADILGRIRLNTAGSLDDVKNKMITLKNGLQLIVDDDDGLTAHATVEFSKEENIWVAKIDWKELNTDTPPIRRSL